jgi:hypothetical protein
MGFSIPRVQGLPELEKLGHLRGSLGVVMDRRWAAAGGGRCGEAPRERHRPQDVEEAAWPAVMAGEQSCICWEEDDCICWAAAHDAVLRACVVALAVSKGAE